MKKNITVLVLSLVYVSLPALFLSLGIGLFTGRYLATFLIVFALTFIFGLVSNTWITNRTIRTIKDLEFKKKALEHQQHVEVSCASCKARNIVPVILSQRNVFDCKDCQKSNVIIFQFATAATTEPLVLPQIGASTNG